MKIRLYRLLQIIVVTLMLSNTSFILAQQNRNLDSLEQELEKTLKTPAPDSVKFDLFAQLFFGYRDINFDKALRYGNEAIQYAEGRDTAQLHKWYTWMAHFYVEYQLYPMALELNRKRRIINEKQHVKNYWWLVNISVIYQADGMYSEAKHSLEQAVDSFKTTLETNPDNANMGVSVCYLNIGQIYEKLEQYDTALAYYHKSIIAANKSKIQYRGVERFLQLSKVHLKLNNKDSAYYYVKKAEEYIKNAYFKDHYPDIYEQKAAIKIWEKKYKEGLTYYDSCIYMAYKYGNTRNVADIYEKKATLFIKLRALDKAIEQYKLGILQADSIRNFMKLSRYNKQVSDLYNDLGKADLAYQYLLEHLKWQDSVQERNLKVKIYKFKSEIEASKSSALKDELTLEKEESRLYRYLILSILAIAIILTLFLFFISHSGKELKKHNEKIRLQNETISAQYEEIAQQNHMLNTYKNDLEQLVAEKTIHLEEALKKAKESDRLKTAFLTNLSHEIRTPMNAIVGFSNLLLDNELDEMSRAKFLDVLLRSTEQLDRVINDIVEISKIESGQIKVNKSYFDINVLFEELTLLFNQKLYELNKNHIQLNFVNQLNSSMIMADRNIIKQVLMNLIDNSIKFTREGSIVFGAKHGKNNCIEVYVKDTGVGILESEFKTIFNQFYKTEGYKKRKNRGMGLGLAISKGLVDKIGGDLIVESEIDKGSCFSFIIPCDR